MRCVSLNCNGLRDKEKRTELFALLEKEKYDVIFLQETFWDAYIEDTASEEWNGNIYSSLYPLGNRKGVSTLISKDCGVKMIRSCSDQSGRLLLTELCIEHQRITFVNIYAPNNNTERKKFFLDLHDRLRGVNTHIVITGDFNNVINTRLDRFPAKHVSDVSRKPLNDLMTTMQLVDIWRKLNPDSITFSRSRQNMGYFTASRIDRFLVSEELCSNVKHCNYSPYPCSDHDRVELQLDLATIPRGTGYWIFNNSLLKDDEFCDIIRELIRAKKEHIEYRTNIFVWYEGLKAEIKKRSITYSKQKQRAMRRNKKQLLKQIKHEREKLLKYHDYDISMLARIESELDELIMEEMRGAALRSKIDWYEDGERSSKFFFNLEKSRQNKKIMTKLVDDNGEVYYDQSSILKEQVKFYRHLYQEQLCNEHSQDELLSNITRTLPQSDVEFCDSPLNSNDLKDALFAMEANKSPGNDGLTAEFYKVFWYDLIHVFETLIEHTFSCNHLCDSMRIGTISLIPKKGDLAKLKNWRPISLLNVDYKIVSKAIANRISKVIQTLISEDQTCCIPGRDISENILIMSNVINYVNDNNLNGLVLKIDQYKAFDCVNHEYLFKALDRMGFGSNILRWIKILYHNITACIKHNGFISESFSIKRGVRQGCPVSALLYVLSAEAFHGMICSSPYISGIQFGFTEARMFQHADDTTFFVSSISSIFEILRIMNIYELASGSKCNVDKTELLVIGSSEVNPSDFDFPVKNDYLVVLGVAMGNTHDLVEKENWENRLTKCMAVLRRWKCRNLSFKGKATVINSLVISRLVYLATVLPIPQWVISMVRKNLMDFIWRGKQPLISYNSLILPVDKGGLKLCDLSNKRDSLRIKYISKILKEDANIKLKNSMLYFLNRYEHMNLGLNIFHIVAQEMSLTGLPMFYQEMLLAWRRLTKGQYVEPLTRDDMLFQPIFHNPFITDKNNVTLFHRSFVDSGIVLVSDLMYEILPSRLPSTAIYECVMMANPDDPISIDEVDSFIAIVMGALPEEWIREIFSSDKVCLLNPILSYH